MDVNAVNRDRASGQLFRGRLGYNHATYASRFQPSSPEGQPVRSKFCILGAILFIVRCCCAQAPTSEVQVPSIPTTNASLKLEDSTPIVLCTKQDLSSATVKAGDRVDFRVVKNVRIEDLVVIRRDAEAWGIVSAVQAKRRKGRPGSLDIAIQSVRLLTGESAPLRAKQHEEGKSRDVATVKDLPHDAIGSFGIFIPVDLVSMLVKGKDADLPAGTRFTAYLNGDVVLDRTALERIQPVPVQRKGPATVTIFRTAETRMVGPPPVYCGKVTLAKLPRPAYLKIQLPPGEYFFRSSFEQTVEVRLEEGQELYLQMQLTVSKSKRGFTNRLVQIDNEDGEEKVANLHQLGDKDVAKVSDANLADLKAAPEVK
jgi:hypothetical protein